MDAERDCGSELTPTGQTADDYLAQPDITTEPLLYPVDGGDGTDPRLDDVFAGLNFTSLFDTLVPEYPPL